MVLQSGQCPDIAIAGGRLAEPQHLGDFGVGKFLKMPQGKDFAVDLFQAVEDFFQPDLLLGPHGGVAGGGEAAKSCEAKRCELTSG